MCPFCSLLEAGHGLRTGTKLLVLVGLLILVAVSSVV
jgi:hypothetical protein